MPDLILSSLLLQNVVFFAQNVMLCYLGFFSFGLLLNLLVMAID